mmetsp:Transcript_20773/g.60706  ORF Transcript_20773/g.60706 Transcript_20773/m.60706 type:complete len:305 (+) Transcript_20773:699-1613(+)
MVFCNDCAHAEAAVDPSLALRVFDEEVWFGLEEGQLFEDIVSRVRCGDTKVVVLLFRRAVFCLAPESGCLELFEGELFIGRRGSPGLVALAPGASSRVVHEVVVVRDFGAEALLSQKFLEVTICVPLGHDLLGRGIVVDDERDLGVPISNGLLQVLSVVESAEGVVVLGSNRGGPVGRPIVDDVHDGVVLWVSLGWCGRAVQHPIAVHGLGPNQAVLPVPGGLILLQHPASYHRLRGHLADWRSGLRPRRPFHGRSGSARGRWHGGRVEVHGRPVLRRPEDRQEQHPNGCCNQRSHGAPHHGAA